MLCLFKQWDKIRKIHEKNSFSWVLWPLSAVCPDNLFSNVSSYKKSLQLLRASPINTDNLLSWNSLRCWIRCGEHKYIVWYSERIRETAQKLTRMRKKRYNYEVAWTLVLYNEKRSFFNGHNVKLFVVLSMNHPRASLNLRLASTHVQYKKQILVSWTRACLVRDRKDLESRRLVWFCWNGSELEILFFITQWTSRQDLLSAKNQLTARYSAEILKAYLTWRRETRRKIF